MFSAIELDMTNIIPSINIHPVIAGVSLFIIDDIKYEPSPGHEKTLSTITLPAIIIPMFWKNRVIIGGSEFFKIKKVIDENSRFLASIGIFTDKVSHFYIKEDVFVSEIMKNPQKIPMLLEPSTGVIRKICDSFGKYLVP